ncbi:MAG TPA: hypothetical protein VF188_18125 [Longimicrobiales bacterium]
MKIAHRRPGFTVLEALAAVVLSAVVLAAVYRTLIVQQVSYREQRERIDSRQTTRTALNLLTTELREISATDGDLLSASEHELTFRALRKMGVVCDVVAGSALHVWQLGEPFEDGDSLLVFMDDDTLRMDDDRWIRGAISGTVSEVASPGADCTQWDAPGIVAALPAPGVAVAEVRKGAPVRAYRSLTYGLYEVDGSWVLGRQGVDGNLVALVGPLLGPEENGLRFRYYNGSGTAVTPSGPASLQTIERVEILVRGRSGGAGSAATVDSLVAQVHLRGNAWN